MLRPIYLNIFLTVTLWLKFIIMRNGSPVAKLVPYTQDSSVKLGLGKGILPELSSLESFNSISIDDSFIGNGEII